MQAAQGLKPPASYFLYQLYEWLFQHHHWQRHAAIKHRQHSLTYNDPLTLKTAEISDQHEATVTSGMVQTAHLTLWAMRI
jgi:hypothetical protein